MLKLCKPSALHLPLLFLIAVLLRTSSASQSLPLRGRDNQSRISTGKTNTLRSSTHLLASASSGKKRRKRRISTGESRENTNVFTNLETKLKTMSAKDNSVKALDSTEPDESAVNKKRQEEKMPSIFVQPDEAIYDKYAACLAATEGLRRTRDGIIDKNRSAVDAKPVTLMRKFWNRGNKDSREGSEKDYERACAQYVLHSGKVIRSMGLSVSRFNQLGREVGSNKMLKERVMEQAYLYRVAATVNMGKLPLIEDPNSKQLLKSHRRQRLQMFVQSSIEIEDLREEQTKRLQNALNIDALPSMIKISDPAILPILDPRVRAVVEAFPLQAEEIVKKYGLNSDEFNQMLEENRTNPIFQRRVKNYMQKHDTLVKGFNECKIPDNP